jgi:hypothetical protein
MAKKAAVNQAMWCRFRYKNVKGLVTWYYKELRSKHK